MDAPRQQFLQVDAIFDAALDREPNERDAFVKAACGNDLPLLERVRTLLAAHERSGAFFDLPALDLAGVLLEDAVPGAAPPERAGPFRILRELGHGGMGVVYLAERDGAEFRQRVALKLVRHSGAGDAVYRRFAEERRILALLEHPRIAHLIDGGLTNDGQPYFAMELVEGEPIDSYCDAHRLSLDQRIDLVVEVCEAVQYAHEHLVIHRDLKPSNILVRADGQLKLLDFGIAKLLDPLRAGDETGATQTIHALTPEYAAPEQFRGQAVNTATDTYALGVLLYKLLAGRRPYEVRGKVPGEVERIVCEVDPQRPSAIAPEGLRRRLRGDLDVIVMKALHKDPTRRYSSAAALRDDLRRFSTGLPVLARPDRAAYRLQKLVRRNRAAVAALSVTFVVLAVATAFSAMQMREAERQRDAALRELQRQQALSEVQAVLAADSRDAHGNPLSAAQRIALAEQVLVQRFSDQPWLVVEGMTSLASQLLELGERESERALLSRASHTARTARLPTQLAISECARAWSFIYDDQFDSARTAIQAAHVALAQPGAMTPAASATCIDAVGQLLVAQGKPDSAITLLRRAYALSSNEDGRSGNLAIMLDLSVALRAAGRTREATVYQRQIVTDREAAGFRGSAILPDVITNLTSSLFELGELTTVDSVLREGISTEARIPGGHSSALLDFLVGLVQLRLGNIDSAELWLTRARRDTTEGAGMLSAYLPPAMTQLRLEQRRFAEARASLASLPQGTLIRRVNRAWFSAWVRYGEGDSPGAATMLEDSLRAITGQSVKPPPSLAMPLVMLAEWRLAAGDAHGADSLAGLARSAAAVDSLALERSAYAGRAELVRARARTASGDTIGARIAVERAVVALSSGYGPANRYTVAAKALRDVPPR